MCIRDSMISNNTKIESTKLVIGKNNQTQGIVEDDESVYNNEFFQYYEHLDNKKRKMCFNMLVKIFNDLIDIIARVFRDRMGLKQTSFSEEMNYKFSDFFFQIHKDELLHKNRK